MAYDEKHVNLVQQASGVICDELRSQARKHDSDKKDGVSEDQHKQNAHHWLSDSERMPNLDIFSIAEAIADNVAGQAQYDTEILFPVADDVSPQLLWILANSIKRIGPKVNPSASWDKMFFVFPNGDKITPQQAEENYWSGIEWVK